MHLVPEQRAHLHTVDSEQVCDAIGGLGAAGETAQWAELFSALSDPGRLSLLLSIQQVPDICVTDLAVAVGMKDAAVSQSLRILRALGLVSARRDGRLIHYRIADEQVDDLLRYVRSHLSVLEAAHH